MNAPQRLPSGYRRYSKEQVKKLEFIRDLRALDFSLPEVSEILLALEQQAAPSRASLEKMRSKIEKIDAKLIELRKLRNLLRSALSGEKVAATLRAGVPE